MNKLQSLGLLSLAALSSPSLADKPKKQPTEPFTPPIEKYLDEQAIQRRLRAVHEQIRKSCGLWLIVSPATPRTSDDIKIYSPFVKIPWRQIPKHTETDTTVPPTDDTTFPPAPIPPDALRLDVYSRRFGNDNTLVGFMPEKADDPEATDNAIRCTFDVLRALEDSKKFAKRPLTTDVRVHCDVRLGQDKIHTMPVVEIDIACETELYEGSNQN